MAQLMHRSNESVGDTHMKNGTEVDSSEGRDAGGQLC